MSAHLRRNLPELQYLWSLRFCKSGEQDVVLTFSGAILGLEIDRLGSGEVVQLMTAGSLAESQFCKSGAREWLVLESFLARFGALNRPPR
jgi:hypothetical protein